MQHKPRLTPFGRLLVVQRVTELGWPPATAAEAVGVSRATAYKWLRRYRELGEAACSTGPRGRDAVPCPDGADRGPHRGGPPALAAGSPPAGAAPGAGPFDRLWGAAPAWPLPADQRRPQHRDPNPLRSRPSRGTPTPRLQEAGPDSERGWSSLPESSRCNPLKTGVGYDYLHVAVDNCSRVAFVQLGPMPAVPPPLASCSRRLDFFAERGARGAGADRPGHGLHSFPGLPTGG